MLKKIYISIHRLWRYAKASLFLVVLARKRWKWLMRGVSFVLIVTVGSILLRNIKGLSTPWRNYWKPAAHQPMHEKHIGLIDIKGPIIASEISVGGTSASNIATSLEKALSNPHAIGVILRINSVSNHLMAASQVYEVIREQKQRHPNKSILAVCATVCTRASYYVASACDAIFAEESSTIGGIGLHYAQTGYVGSLKKLGIERRLYTAGKNKAALDQYSPMSSQARQMMQSLLNDWHAQLIEGIKLGRGDRLKNLEQNAEILFSGRIWLGKEALKLGLIDGLGSIHSVARDILKRSKIVDYSIRPNFMQSILGQ